MMSCAGNGRGVLKLLTVNSAQHGHVNFYLIGVVILSYTTSTLTSLHRIKGKEYLTEYCRLMVTSTTLVSHIYISTDFLSSTAQHSGNRHVVSCRNASPMTAGH